MYVCMWVGYKLLAQTCDIANSLKHQQRVDQAIMVSRKPFLKLTFLSTLHN